MFAKDHVQSGESEYNKGIQNQFWNNGYFFFKKKPLEIRGIVFQSNFKTLAVVQDGRKVS